MQASMSQTSHEGVVTSSMSKKPRICLLFAPNIMSSISREHIDTYAKTDNLKKLDITVEQKELTI